jgi:hypothetical protein
VDRLAILRAAANTARFAAVAVGKAVLAATRDLQAERLARQAERRAQCRVLRDIEGNPFQAVALDPEWRTPTVLAIARRAHEDRDFAGLPVLADALEDAGCTDQRILTHCRRPSEHVRGCWVLGAVLARS